MHEIFQVFNPKNHFIDRATGYMNRGMSLQRDYAAIHSCMWDLDERIANYLENPDGDSAASLSDYGLDIIKDRNDYEGIFNFMYNRYNPLYDDDSNFTAFDVR